MEYGGDKEPNFINDKETNLYSTSRGSGNPVTHELSGTAFKVRQKIDDTILVDKKNQKTRGGLAKKFFLISFLILCIAMIYAGYKLFFSESREDFISRHIDIVMDTVPFTRGGEPLNLNISVTNKNNVALQNVSVEIEYPRGSEAVTRDDFERQTVELGNINPGQKIEKNVTLILYGEQGSYKDLKANLEYSIPDSSLSYNKISKTGITISSSPIIMEIDAPKDIAPSQLYTMRIRITQNTKALPNNALFTIVLPRDFTVETFSRKPDYGVGTWLLKSVKEGDYEDITINGRFNSQEGDERSFKFLSGVPESADQNEIKTSYVSKTHVVTVAKPLMDAYIVLGEEKGKTIAVDPDSYVTGTLIYRNRSNTAVKDPKFRIKLTGSALEEASISPIEGFYDSNTKEIFWDKNTLASLNNIPAGQEGRLTFSFRVLPRSVNGPSFVKEPIVNLALSYSGVRDDESQTFQSLENIENASVRVSTELKISADVIHATGALPPKAGSETTYQITLTLTNTHNDVTGAKLISKIPFYMKWVGKVSKNEKISYNPDTREVIWNLGDIKSGSGTSANERKGVFQVSIIPSISQAESAPEILQNIRFSGTDLFSNKDVKAIYPNLTTRISNGTDQDGLVTQ